MERRMSDEDDANCRRGEMLLSVALLYWALHERLDGADPDLTKQERVFLVWLATPRRMGDLADGLETRGLVTRSRDPDDRRAMLLELTQAGRAARRRLLAQIDRAMREATGLSEPDLEEFAVLLFRIRYHIKAEGLPKGLPF